MKSKLLIVTVFFASVGLSSTVRAETVGVNILNAPTNIKIMTPDLSQKMSEVHTELDKVFQDRIEAQESSSESVQTVPSVTVPDTPQTSSEGSISTHNGFTVNSKKEAIAMSESGGDYNATNGRYIGKYQLDAAYLGGDFSPENQERVFEQYCTERYGGIDGAWEHWQTYGWY